QLANGSPSRALEERRPFDSRRHRFSLKSNYPSLFATFSDIGQIPRYFCSVFGLKGVGAFMRNQASVRIRNQKESISEGRYASSPRSIRSWPNRPSCHLRLSRSPLPLALVRHPQGSWKASQTIGDSLRESVAR